MRPQSLYFRPLDPGDNACRHVELIAEISALKSCLPSLAVDCRVARHLNNGAGEGFLEEICHEMATLVAITK
ncbi:MAG: hypothetical protein JWM11_6313 [Planctomycetaceae bacterium]|nr:hypothetical protein [Planctomycetaceae bacterium]